MSPVRLMNHKLVRFTRIFKTDFLYSFSSVPPNQFELTAYKTDYSSSASFASNQILNRGWIRSFVIRTGIFRVEWFKNLLSGNGDLCPFSYI